MILKPDWMSGSRSQSQAFDLFDSLQTKRASVITFLKALSQFYFLWVYFTVLRYMNTFQRHIES